MNDEKKLSDDDLKDIAGGAGRVPPKKGAEGTKDGSGKGTFEGGGELDKGGNVGIGTTKPK